MSASQLDQRCIDTLRFLAVDAVEKADSGHPGLPLGAMPMAYVLWDRFLRHSPHNPGWTDRDRFVLSAGHGSALQYALLYATGYELTLDDLKRHYNAVIFATGAQTDRSLGIPGEDLPGSHAATEFVAWYNGHPDYRDRHFNLNTQRAVVVGVGNVAMDAVMADVTDVPGPPVSAADEFVLIGLLPLALNPAR